MKSDRVYELSGGRKALKWLYILTFTVMAFTGFGQMPIFKRYYVSDIPGMGWSANFYLTHYIHYLGAIFLIGLIAYIIVDYILSGRKEFGLTSSAYVRIALLGAIVVTGIFRVLKNLPDVVFSPGFTLFIDISHLGFMMLYLLTALVFSIMKSGWLRGIDD
jgi:heme A synthase